MGELDHLHFHSQALRWLWFKRREKNW